MSLTAIQSPTALGTSDVNSSIAALANGDYVTVYEPGDSNPFFDDVRAKYSRGKTATHSRSPLAGRFSHAKPCRERYSRIVAGFLQNRKIIRFRMKNHRFHKAAPGGICASLRSPEQGQFWHQRAEGPMRIDVEFSSLGATLRGWLYQPDVPLAPAVIMAHGFSATRSMTIDKYAEAFCDAGFAVLLYDHRGFGASDGDPPRWINPWVQARGYLDAVAFLSKLDGVDPGRISVWGDSLSAGVACVAASIDQRIGAIIVQVPAFGASEPPADSDGKLFKAMQAIVMSSDALDYGGPVQGPMPVVSSDQVRHPSALKPLTAFRWFVEYGGTLNSNWVNDVALSVEGWHPGLCAPYLKQPVLMLVSPQDEMARANPQVARAVFDSVCGSKQWYAISGGHFGLLYHPSDLFSEARAVQLGFLRRWADGDMARSEVGADFTGNNIPASTTNRAGTGSEAREDRKRQLKAFARTPLSAIELSAMEGE